MKDDDFYYQRTQLLLDKLNATITKTFYYSVAMLFFGYSIGYWHASQAWVVPTATLLLATIFWYLGFRVKYPEEKTPK
jgi:hypothetical protein